MVGVLIYITGVLFLAVIFLATALAGQVDKRRAADRARDGWIDACQAARRDHDALQTKYTKLLKNYDAEKDEHDALRGELLELLDKHQ